MKTRVARDGVVLLGLVACLSSTGCAAAGELGMKFAAAVLEQALKPSPSSGSSGSAPVVVTPEADAEVGETACRIRLRDWKKATGGSDVDAPPHLRCKANGDWPDEDSLRTNMNAGM